MNETRTTRLRLKLKFIYFLSSIKKEKKIYFTMSRTQYNLKVNVNVYVIRERGFLFSEY